MTQRQRILVATHPFGESNEMPRKLLDSSGHEIIYNPYGRRLRGGEVEELLPEFEGVIAGTEPYPSELVERCPGLRVISRVGIGLDNLCVADCHASGVKVTYTPDAPSAAVAELTICLMLGLLRHVNQSDRSVREQAWNRLVGFLMEEVTVGVLGVGRIGSRVIKLLQPFGCRILAYDPVPNEDRIAGSCVEWAGLDRVLGESDLLTIHIPLTRANREFMGRDRLRSMKRGAALVNTSRGGVIDEKALIEALDWGHLSGAAMDVFCREPYEGAMAAMDNTILTAHIGASTHKTRFLMELGATQDCLRVLAGEAAMHPAPAEDC